MEEKKGDGLMMFCVAAFVIFLVSIMSFSLWRTNRLARCMATNHRAWGIRQGLPGRGGGTGSGLI